MISPRTPAQAIRPNKIDAQADAERLALYDAGLSDHAIAARQGVHRTSVRMWRKARNFPPNCPKDIIKDQRRSLYDQGLNDRQIAERAGVDQTAVLQWRHRNGLPPVPGAYIRWDAQLERRARKLLALNVPVSVIAETLERPIQTLVRWRAKLLRVNPELRMKSGRRQQRRHSDGRLYSKLRPENRREALLLYADGLNDADIARAMRLSVRAIWEWRSAFFLQVNRRRTARRRKRKPTGPAITPMSNPIYAAIRRAVGFNLASDVAEDATSELWLAIAERRASVDALADEGKRFRNLAEKEYANRWGDRSLDEEIGEAGNGLRLMDLVRDDRSSSWLEEMGASVW